MRRPTPLPRSSGMADLILASTSKYRRELLTRLKLPFETVAPGVDEVAVKAAGGPAREVVEELARRKAEAVRRLRPSDVVIGSDQAAVLDGEVLDKPGTETNAVAQLRSLRGRRHQLITAVAVAHPGGIERFTDVTNLTMRRLTGEEITRYVRAEMPLDCAGSYKIEGLGVTLFEQIETRDHTAIVGLPLAQLSDTLRDLGFALP